MTTKDIIKDIIGVDSVSDAELKAFNCKSYTIVCHQFDTSMVIISDYCG
ncbi:hypothetical protein [Veillonella caviae]|nr:hypothetical protein [Veillonella caviae]MDY5787947.1 hypothetical protein [Veillonella caviae]